jgi:hypothetical protein
MKETLTVDQFKALNETAKTKRKLKKTEEKLQVAVSDYLKMEYPHVYFSAESSGIRVPMHTAKNMKKQRSCDTHLDCNIFFPKDVGSVFRFHGLILELKQESESPYLKNMQFTTQKHERDQLQSVIKLRNLGYCAGFVVGFDHAKAVIDWYMTGGQWQITPIPLSQNVHSIEDVFVCLYWRHVKKQELTIEQYPSKYLYL